MAATALAVPAVAGAASPPTFADGSGIHVTATAQLNPRLTAVVVTTPALKGPANVRILLPTAYATHPRKRYPVLYLLHGTSGGAANWAGVGRAEATVADRPVIVVMPDIALNDDGGGWCTDWVNGGAYGTPKWETFHIDQLVPWVDRNLRTIPDRAGRAVAGLSQGGFCAMSYAARHPDLFTTAVSFSGAPDIAFDADARRYSTPIINATELALDHVPANSMFGPRDTNEVNWAAHDPASLAVNLRNTTMRLYTGNGQPGPLDTPSTAGAGAIEVLVHRSTELFHTRLQALHIPSFYDDYGPGTHSWPYWARDLEQAIDPIMAAFKHPAKVPARITYTSADPRYAAFGWRVATHRPAREFSTLSRAGRTGFTLAGSGSATVVTPRSFAPRGRYCIIATRSSATRTVTSATSRSGRLRVTVKLGPGNVRQQFTSAAVTKVFTTKVAIAARPRAGCRA